MGDRGPAKGYVEHLEHRLQVTEGVLLKILNGAISDEQLEALFPGQKPYAGTTYAPLERPDKRGIEHWSQFPLDSAADIRKWSHSVTGQGSAETGGIDPSELSSPSVESQTPRGTKRKEFTNGPDGHYGQGSGFMPAGLKQRRTSQTTSVAPPAHQGMSQPPRTFHWGMQADKHPLYIGSLESIDPVNYDGRKSNTSWHGAPSANFQSQFLW